jgi:hypothetical protein
MRFRPSVIAGFGVGYLLGTRAGRERYDEILRRARDFSERPEVQGAAGLVFAQAGQFATRVRGVVTSRAGGGGRHEGGTAPFPGASGVHSPNGSGRPSEV